MKRKVFLAIVAVIATIMMPMSGHAASTVGNFEIDGNTADDSGAGDPLDWATLPGATTFTDPEGTECPAGIDTIFTGGGSKENTPGSWIFSCGSAQSKSDITGGAIGQRKIGADDFLYISMTRAGDSGSANVSAEFNKSTATFDNDANPATPQIPMRTAGDFLVFMEITNGGSVTTPQIFSWSGTHISGVWVQSASAPVQGTGWDAATNVTTGSKWNFAELALNVGAFGFVKSCPGLGAQWLKTNSTSKIDSGVLADRTVRKGLNLSTCGTKNWEFSFNPRPISGTTVWALYTFQGGETRERQLTDPDGDGTFTAVDDRIPPGTVDYRFQVRNGTNVVWTSPPATETFAPEETKTNVGSLAYEIDLSPPSAENFAGRPHVLTATVTETGTGTPLPNVGVSFAVSSAAPAGCATLDPTSGTSDASGQVTTTLTAAAGCTVSVVAWVNGNGGSDGLDDGEASDTAGKTFVAYTMSVEPPVAFNAPGTNHTFTVSLFRDTGSGPGGYAGQSVDLTLDPGVSDAHFVTINGADASGTTGTCTTDEAGTCEVVITSTTPGTSTLEASFTTMNDSGEGTVSSTGTKTYVDYRVSVSPPNADNEVTDPHTVVVTVERDSGDGWGPAEGIDVSLGLDAGGTDAHLVSINGGAAEGTSGTCTTTADGTCTVVFVATQAGSVTLTASIGVVLDSGTLERSAVAGKVYSDFRLNVSPNTAVNEVGVPHTFTITLERNDGNGFFGYAGQTVMFSLDAGDTDAQITSINGEPASGTSGTCVTGGAGTCEVVIVSSTPGSVTLTADWSGTFSDPSTATRTGSAEKIYLKAGLVKTACPTDRAAPGGRLDYSVAVSLAGGDLHNATLLDRLPAGFRFESASPAPDSAPEPGTSGDVVWNLGTLAAGSSPSFSISGSVDPAVASGTTLTNVATLSADEIVDKVATTDTLVSTEGASAIGSAFGLSSTGLLSIPETPDTDDTNPAEQIGIHDAAPLIDAGLLQVAESGGVTNTSASDTAVAKTASVAIDAGVVKVEAETIVARSSSSASGNNAGSTSAGSTIQRLVVNGDEYVNVREPMTIRIPGPTGDPIAEVRVLETIETGAADGVAQPAGGLYSSSQAVNGLHVIVLGTGLDVIVAHADSSASFPSGRACGAETSSVAGDASLVSLFNVVPGLGDAKTGLVTLDSTGGEESASVAGLTPLGVFAGATYTSGSLDPLQATSIATVSALAGGPITATLIKAKSGTENGSSGETTIAALTINGTDVCAALGLEGTCTPDPDTVLLLDGGNVIVLLNEQIGGDGLRVNAVHIFIVGRDNPLGLPAGAEIVISSAFSNTSA